jgi:hypothetical protein
MSEINISTGSSCDKSISSTYIASRNWEKSVRSAYKKECDFLFCTAPSNEFDVLRPLLIIVHPGDAVEDGVGFSNKEDAFAVKEFGQKNTRAMALEIDHLLDNSDVIILHRQSTIDVMMKYSLTRMTEADKLVHPYQFSCLKASELGVVLYGDDLDAASQWIIRSINVVDRPSIFMTGAYACENFGCITSIGKSLEKFGCTNITVSQHAPTDNSNYSPRWVPQNGVGNDAILIREGSKKLKI